MQAGVPQSLDKDSAEDRKPVELVPPSGIKSNCWWLGHQHLILVSCPLSSLLPLKQRHEHRLTRQLSLEVGKGRSEKTKLKDHI